MTIFSSELMLAQALIQTQSYSAQESQAAKLLLKAFEALEFDEAYLDKAGNAIGVFRRGAGPHIMLNGHLDTVPVGDTALWRHGPLSGQVEDGELWGRGSVDMKSALACMTFAARDAAAQGFAGTLTVSGVVQEETGGLGARYLGDMIKPDVVILGEPSNLNLMLGHRGRIEIAVTFPGRIAHAAKNELGENALYHASRFLEQLRTLKLPSGGPLGGSSVTPTNLRSFPEGGHNVVPGSARLVLDYRFIPDDTPESVLERLRALAPEAHFDIITEAWTTENGQVTQSYPHIAPAYLAPGENHFIQQARPIIKEALALFEIPFAERVWWFATDAPHLARQGAPVIGFGPGSEDFAHTTQERVPVRHLEIARAVYRDLALKLAD